MCGSSWRLLGRRPRLADKNVARVAVEGTVLFEEGTEFLPRPVDTDFGVFPSRLSSTSRLKTLAPGNR
jgi:hypothetical protein